MNFTLYSKSYIQIWKYTQRNKLTYRLQAKHIIIKCKQTIMNHIEHKISKISVFLSSSRHKWCLKKKLLSRCSYIRKMNFSHNLNNCLQIYDFFIGSKLFAIYET